MHGENGTPPTPEWSVEPRPWCTARTGTCGAVCESRQHCIWLAGGDSDEHLIRGEN